MADPRRAVRLRVTVPDEVRAGAPLPIVAVAENTTGSPVELYLRGRRPTFDVIVQSQGETIWRLLDGAVVPAIVQLVELSPGETIEFRTQWDQCAADGQPVAAGAFAIQVTLLLELPPPLESPVVPVRITRA